MVRVVFQTASGISYIHIRFNFNTSEITLNDLTIKLQRNVFIFYIVGCITLTVADIQWNYKTENVVTIGILKFPFRTDFYLKTTMLSISMHLKVGNSPK